MLQLALELLHLGGRSAADMRRALEVLRRGGRSAAEVLGTAVVGVPVAVIVSGAGLRRRDR